MYLVEDFEASLQFMQVMFWGERTTGLSAWAIPGIRKADLECENSPTCQYGNNTFPSVVHEVFCSQIIGLQAHNFIFKLSYHLWSKVYSRMSYLLTFLSLVYLLATYCSMNMKLGKSTIFSFLQNSGRHIFLINDSRGQLKCPSLAKISLLEVLV